MPRRLAAKSTGLHPVYREFESHRGNLCGKMPVSKSGKLKVLLNMDLQILSVLALKVSDMIV